MLDFSLGLDAKLHIVAICSSDNADPLDILNWEGLDTLLFVPNQTKATYPTTICEGDISTIWVKLPASCLVFHTPVIVLKLWVSLLPRLFVLAILVKPGNSKPRAICTGLTSLGVKSRGERVLFGKYCIGGLQVVFRDILPIHPQAQTLVADELGGTNG